jgi:TolB-like protein/Tfp pilus assembly protein PilF
VSLPPVLPDLIADRYRFVREIGRGGMACVYLARDLKHRRDVAIKVIRPELSAPLGQDRFVREIEIAARLRHPNIVPLYDSGEAGGSFYFVMPYEEGQSLRERLDQTGPLPLADALGVLRDIARALAYAHEHGVVHRDVKPDNVMLSGGAAVVADFGIAKAVGAALTDPAGPITQTGFGIGTPAYMAPEQATGDTSTDHRADLYSLGCLAYELFTGKPPFHDKPLPQIVAAHLTTVPDPVTASRPEVPPSVARIIARCLEKDPANRPQSAREVLGSLDADAPAAARRPARALRWATLALVAVAIAVGTYLARRDPAGSAPITLAVLPFGSLGTDSAMRIVAEGLADEVAGVLTRVPGIQIKSRNGALFYRGRVGVDAGEAGARLKADYVMSALIRPDRGRWILSADLSRADDAASLWGDTFGLDPDQFAGAAEAIAGGLVAGLRTLFPNTVGSAPALASNQRTSSNEAYRLYLQGQERLNRRGGSVSQSAELFGKAIRIDSLFAPAWSGLSMALALFPYFEEVPAREVHDDLVRAARRALELDPTLAQPHVALGLDAWFDYRWDDAERELRTAVGLDGRNVEALVQYARHLYFVGRIAEAMVPLQRARAEDPASALVLGWVAAGYYLQGQMDSALAESRRAVETDSTSYASVIVAASIRLGNNLPGEARKLIDRTPRAMIIHEYVIAKSGDRATALERLAELDARSPQPWLAETRRAFAYLGLGDTAKALTALERATDNRELWPVMLGEKAPMFDPVRESARYQALLRRIGLRETSISKPGASR